MSTRTRVTEDAARLPPSDLSRELADLQVEIGVLRTQLDRQRAIAEAERRAAALARASAERAWRLAFLPRERKDATG
jgi:hypothetical protein